ncbi:MAG: DUF3168 domain-containing protein [Sulfuriferula sp.]
MIEETLQATLSTLVGGRVYPLVAPDSPVKPYIIYQNIANSPNNTLADGVPINNTRMQIDCYDVTYAGVKNLAAGIIAAMATASFTNILTMNQDLFEPDPKLYRIQHDFSIWY